MHQPDTQSPGKLSQTRFAAFRLHHHLNEFSTILHGGRLMQRYAVDLWASADQERLRFIYFNQEKIRADLYQSVEDALDNDGNLKDIGQHVILPASYIGGPRNMQQHFQDAMAVA